jgi:uncharacterized membrane protein YdjX (TVP38/TMEM64 family)
VTRSIWLRAALLGLVLVIGAVVATTVDLPDVDTLRTWLAGAGGAGWVLIVLGLSALLLAPVPRSVLSVLVGLVAGFWAGLAIALISGLLGALGAFALARTLGRPAVARFAGSRLERVDRLALDRGFLAVLIGRVLPVAPFVVLSYGAGLTTVRPGAYAAGTALGLVPTSVVQVGIGASVGTIVAGAGTVTAVALVAPAAAGLGAALLWWRRNRSAAASPS